MSGATLSITGILTLDAPDGAVAAAGVSTAPTAQWPSLLGSMVGFVGDSYTSGYGLASPSTNRWPKLLANMVGAAENNQGVPSAGYSNQGSGGNSKFSTQATLLSPACTSVIMCGGINDAPLGLSTGALQTEVTAAINAIKARVPAAKIIVLSPMWMASQPTPGLLLVESQIRGAIPSDVRFIEKGPWLRLDRVEWQQADGHPNDAGAAAIAAWVRDQLGGTPAGAEHAQFVTPGTSDISLTGANFPSNVLASGTVLGAKSGWWELEAQAVLYGAVPGFIWAREQSRKVALRSDVQGAPSVHRQTIRFYHPGGDLAVACGYDPSGTNAMVITSAQTKITARRLGI